MYLLSYTMQIVITEPSLHLFHTTYYTDVHTTDSAALMPAHQHVVGAQRLLGECMNSICVTDSFV